MKKASTPAARGRPRAFDPEVALDRAVEVFWRKGYEGATLSDLTEALGVNRPSLYAAFGNKEQLFRRAMDRYSAGPMAFFARALEKPTAREVAKALLDGAVEMLADDRTPVGCLAVQGALCSGDEARPIQQELMARRNRGLAAIRRRLERASAEGDLPKGAKAADLARFLSTVIHGLSIQAVGGATRKEMQRVAEMSLQLWPR